jgi:hypothetical protein
MKMKLYRGRFSIGSRKELMVVVESNRVAFILRLEKNGTETDGTSSKRNRLNVYV